MAGDNNLIQIHLVVPELRNLLSVVGSCCALPVDFLIEESVREVEQVHDVVVSEAEGVVRVWTLRDFPELREELVARIEGLGFKVNRVDCA